MCESTHGSWRTTVLLDQGEYQFVGKVQMEGLQTGPGIARGGVTLRMSGERSAKMVTEASEWTTLTYDFTMPALADIELLCEFLLSERERGYSALTSARTVRVLATSGVCIRLASPRFRQEIP